MTRRLVVPLTMLAFATTAIAQEKTGITPDVSKQAPAEVKRAGPGVGMAKRISMENFKVKEVDQGKRMLVLQDFKGAEQTMQVGPAVKRLDQVSAGDTIKVSYEQTLVLEHRPEGSGVADSKTATVRAEQGAPAGARGTLTRSDVKVTKIDPKSRLVTLQAEKGKPFTVKAGSDIDLAKVKVGQTYYANYLKITAVKVEKAAAKAAPPVK